MPQALWSLMLPWTRADVFVAPTWMPLDAFPVVTLSRTFVSVVFAFCPGGCRR